MAWGSSRKYHNTDLCQAPWECWEGQSSDGEKCQERSLPEHALDLTELLDTDEWLGVLNPALLKSLSLEQQKAGNKQEFPGF